VAGVAGPATILALTFVVGAAFAFYQPAQQASVNDLVSRAELPQAVSLNAIAFNVSRALGPALAGALTAWIGSGSALIASACFFGIMVYSVRRLKPRELALPGVPERLLSGVQVGLRYARHSPQLRAFILRTLAFTACACALWALLPIIARDQLHLGAGGYGFLFGMFGIGAVAGALSIPHQLRRRSLNRVVYSGTMLWAMAALLIAATEFTALAAAGTFCAGAAWVTVHASLSAGTQSSVPGWVRARSVAMNLVAVQAVHGARQPRVGPRRRVDRHAARDGALGDRAVRADPARARRARAHGQRGGRDARRGAARARAPRRARAARRAGADPGRVPDPAEHREAFLQAIRKVGPDAAAQRRDQLARLPRRRARRALRRALHHRVVGRVRAPAARMTMADRALQQRAQDLQAKDTPIRVSRFLGVE
jgi:hypothetical protein